MPLTLDQYATYLDTPRPALAGRAEPDPPKVRPHLEPIEGVKAVLWNVYGTLLAIPGGELKFEVDQRLRHERGPGQDDPGVQDVGVDEPQARPAGRVHAGDLHARSSTSSGSSPAAEKYPEVAAERVWEAIVKKLLQKDYKFDAGFYGSLNEFSRRRSPTSSTPASRGPACYPSAAAALRRVRRRGLSQGLLADGQCFTTDAAAARPGDAGRRRSSWTSCSRRPDGSSRTSSAARKPSDTLFRPAARGAGQPRDRAARGAARRLAACRRTSCPAKQLGMKTALFAGDKASLVATAEQLKDPHYRPGRAC